LVLKENCKFLIHHVSTLKVKTWDSHSNDNDDDDDDDDDNDGGGGGYDLMGCDV
jgi:hypothetical protein